MKNLMAWGILIIVFFIAGEGLNLFRIHIVAWLAYGRWQDAVLMLFGVVLALLCTAFLGGFVYYRDKKRGKLKREGWRGRPIKRHRSSPAPASTHEKPLQ